VWVNYLAKLEKLTRKQGDGDVMEDWSASCFLPLLLFFFRFISVFGFLCLVSFFLAFWIPSSSLFLWRLPDKLWFWDEEDEDVRLLVESDAFLCFVLFFFFVLSCLYFCLFFRLWVCLSLSVMSVFPSLLYFLPLSPCVFLGSFLPGFFSVCSSLFFLGFSVRSCLSFLVFLFFFTFLLPPVFPPV